MLHAEEREIEAGKIIVVNTAVNESRRQTNLADVLFDCEFGCP